jgi:hypothetical protein
MLVGANLDAVVNAGFENELGEDLISFRPLNIVILRRHGCFKDAQECLDYVVSMHILSGKLMKRDLPSTCSSRI